MAKRSKSRPENLPTHASQTSQGAFDRGADDGSEKRFAADVLAAFDKLNSNELEVRQYALTLIQAVVAEAIKGRLDVEPDASLREELAHALQRLAPRLTPSDAPEYPPRQADVAVPEASGEKDKNMGSETTSQASSDESAGSPENESYADYERQLQVFRQALPQLLKTHPKQWVAIHGGRLLGPVPSVMELDDLCRHEGFFLDECLYRVIEHERLLDVAS